MNAISFWLQLAPEQRIALYAAVMLRHETPRTENVKTVMECGDNVFDPHFLRNLAEGGNRLPLSVLGQLNPILAKKPDLTPAEALIVLQGAQQHFLPIPSLVPGQEGTYPAWLQ